MSKDKPTAQIKASEVTFLFDVLADLISANQQPFEGQAKRILYKLQPEIKFIRQSEKDDLEAILDMDIDLGQKIQAPQHFPDEYENILKKVCHSMPVKESQLKKKFSKAEESEKKTDKKKGT